METGLCADCNAPDCICNYILTTRRCKPKGKIKVILVGGVWVIKNITVSAFAAAVFYFTLL